MAEYWVSRKKWTCKYCDITINDDLPSRQQHENGLRHKGNVERALKDLYRKSEHDKRDAEHARREMVRIEKLAKQAHEADLARTGATASGPVISSDFQAASTASTSTAKAASPSAPPPRKDWKPKDRLSAYGSAIADQSRIEEEEAERLRVEQAAQEAATRDGVPGQWESVSTSASGSSNRAEPTLAPPTSDRDKARNFKVRERQGAYLDDDGDEEGDAAQINVKKRIKVENSTQRQRQQEEEQRRMLPQWSGVRLGAVKAEEERRGADERVRSKSEDEQATETSASVKQEDGSPADAQERPDTMTPPSGPAVKEEGDAEGHAKDTKPAAGGGMFRKRKTGAGSGAKKVRMF